MPRSARRRLDRENAKRPSRLTPLPRDRWPRPGMSPNRIAVYVSGRHLAQVFDEGGSVLRVSVNRTTMRPDGEFDDGLSWDELQEVKRQLGYGDRYAVEVYPRDRDIVNVANMRHLWVLPNPVVGWVNELRSGTTTNEEHQRAT